jgi:hypothetical protein
MNLVGATPITHELLNGLQAPFLSLIQNQAIGGDAL